jgi:hypothetical protein
MPVAGSVALGVTVEVLFHSPAYWLGSTVPLGVT